MLCLAVLSMKYLLRLRQGRCKDFQIDSLSLGSLIYWSCAGIELLIRGAKWPICPSEERTERRKTGDDDR